MKPLVPADIANENGKPEDHLAAATMALHKAMDGMEAPAKVIEDALAVAVPLRAIQPLGNGSSALRGMTEADARVQRPLATVSPKFNGHC